MKTNLISGLVIVLAVFAAAWGFSLWMHETPEIETLRRDPGLDGYDPKLVAAANKVNIGEHFSKKLNPIQPSTNAPGEWVCFRGRDRSNVITDGPKLADSWPKEGPPVLWEVEVGQGYAAPAVYKGRVYLLDYLEEVGQDSLRCITLDEGKKLWERSYAVKVKNDHGMSRTIPAVTDKYLVTIGPMCHVMCVDTLTGDLRWGIDLIKDYGSKRPPWHTGQCPLIEDNVAIIAPMGTEALIMGVDCETGRVLWKTPNPDLWEMSHASIMPMTHNGKRMYVVAAIGGMAGVSAEKGEEGKVLWKTTAYNKAVIAPSPLVLPEGRIFMTAGYGAGSIVLRITDKFEVNVLQEFKPKEGMASEQQTPILYKGLVFGINPKDAGGMRQQFVACRPDDFKTMVWTSGKEHKFGLGPYIVADDKFYILGDKSELTMAAFSETEFKILGQHKFWKGHESWGPLAIAGTRMLLRDLSKMICIELGKQ